MPLSQNPTTPQDTAVAPVRLDAQMQKRVIARALELQRQQQDTLTPEQLEAVAAEAGIEATFVRQAVAQVAAERPAAQQWLERLRDHFSSDVRRHERAVATGMGLAAFMGGVGGAGLMPDLLYILPLGAAWAGRLLGGWERAFQVGAAMGVAEIVAGEVAHRVVHPHAMLGSTKWDLLWIALCAGSSVLGAAIRRFATGRRFSPAVGADSVPNQG